MHICGEKSIKTDLLTATIKINNFIIEQIKCVLYVLKTYMYPWSIVIDLEVAAF